MPDLPADGAVARHSAKPRYFLTNINSPGAVAITMNFDPQQEDAMGTRSKSGTARGATHKAGASSARGRGRKPANAPEAWEQTAQTPDERLDEIDCQRIVQGDGGRGLPRDFDDYN